MPQDNRTDITKSQDKPQDSGVPTIIDADKFMAEGIACYTVMMNGLLDIVMVSSVSPAKTLP